MRASFARRRLGGLALVVVGAGLALALVAVDAAQRVREGEAAQAEVARTVRVTGLPELALSTSSSWLRHPALAPPSGGAADSPSGLDVDPAGAAIPRRAHERTLSVERAP